MITVMLYGHLSKTFGKRVNLEVKSPAEAIRALCTIVPGFKRRLMEKSDPGYRVIVGKSELDKDELINPIGSEKTIKIIPVVVGAGAAGRIILGVVLIVIGYFCACNPYLINMGVSLIIGGVSELLFAAPVKGSSGSNESADNQPSYTFDGAVNTAAQGNPVPLCYGKMIVGSQVVSAGLSVEQINTGTATVTIDPFIFLGGK